MDCTAIVWSGVSHVENDILGVGSVGTKDIVIFLTSPQVVFGMTHDSIGICVYPSSFFLSYNEFIHTRKLSSRVNEMLLTLCNKNVD